jgi:hypothetical protein
MQLAIVAAGRADLEAVMQLLREARGWHQAQGVEAWREFDLARIAADIDAGCVYIAHGTAGVCATVTLMESDAQVWAEEQGDAIYVHKLALRWARGAARQKGRRWLRLDTWDGNRKMRDYYERQGFRHVRDQYFAPDSPLPADYRGTHKSLYQLEL